MSEVEEGRAEEGKVRVRIGSWVMKVILDD